MTRGTRNSGNYHLPMRNSSLYDEMMRGNPDHFGVVNAHDGHQAAKEMKGNRNSGSPGEHRSGLSSFEVAEKHRRRSSSGLQRPHKICRETGRPLSDGGRNSVPSGHDLHPDRDIPYAGAVKATRFHSEHSHIDASPEDHGRAPYSHEGNDDYSPRTSRRLRKPDRTTIGGPRVTLRATGNREYGDEADRLSALAGTTGAGVRMTPDRPSKTRKMDIRFDSHLGHGVAPELEGQEDPGHLRGAGHHRGHQQHQRLQESHFAIGHTPVPEPRPYDQVLDFDHVENLKKSKVRLAHEETMTGKGAILGDPDHEVGFLEDYQGWLGRKRMLQKGEAKARKAASLPGAPCYAWTAEPTGAKVVGKIGKSRIGPGEGDRRPSKEIYTEYLKTRVKAGRGSDPRDVPAGVDCRRFQPKSRAPPKDEKRERFNVEDDTAAAGQDLPEKEGGRGKSYYTYMANRSALSGNPLTLRQPGDFAEAARRIRADKSEMLPRGDTRDELRYLKGPRRRADDGTNSVLEDGTNEIPTFGHPSCNPVATTKARTVRWEPLDVDPDSPARKVAASLVHEDERAKREKISGEYLGSPIGRGLNDEKRKQWERAHIREAHPHDRDLIRFHENERGELFKSPKMDPRKQYTYGRSDLATERELGRRAESSKPDTSLLDHEKNHSLYATAGTNRDGLFRQRESMRKSRKMVDGGYCDETRETDEESNSPYFWVNRSVRIPTGCTVPPEYYNDPETKPGAFKDRGLHNKEGAYNMDQMRGGPQTPIDADGQLRSERGPLTREQRKAIRANEKVLQEAAKEKLHHARARNMARAEDWTNMNESPETKGLFNPKYQYEQEDLTEDNGSSCASSSAGGQHPGRQRRGSGDDDLLTPFDSPAHHGRRGGDHDDSIASYAGRSTKEFARKVMDRGPRGARQGKPERFSINRAGFVVSPAQQTVNITREGLDHDNNGKQDGFTMRQETPDSKPVLASESVRELQARARNRPSVADKLTGQRKMPGERSLSRNKRNGSRVVDIDEQVTYVDYDTGRVGVPHGRDQDDYYSSSAAGTRTQDEQSSATGRSGGSRGSAATDNYSGSAASRGVDSSRGSRRAFGRQNNEDLEDHRDADDYEVDSRSAASSSATGDCDHHEAARDSRQTFLNYTEPPRGGQRSRGASASAARNGANHYSTSASSKSTASSRPQHQHLRHHNSSSASSAASSASSVASSASHSSASSFYARQEAKIRKREAASRRTRAIDLTTSGAFVDCLYPEQNAVSPVKKQVLAANGRRSCSPTRATFTRRSGAGCNDASKVRAASQANQEGKLLYHSLQGRRNNNSARVYGDGATQYG
ncbi:unnamed protein product [Amoebophrya sp. A25]|nr:unnamed protein product [Amoebophrya sp. A25]|eukprot:GSA25T00022278001.1